MLDWMTRGKCVSLPQAMFVPPDWPTPDPEAAAELDARWYDTHGVTAKAVCAGCPVSDLCFEEAMSDPTTIENGVWGGTTPEDRRSIIEALSV